MRHGHDRARRGSSARASTASADEYEVAPSGAVAPTVPHTPAQMLHLQRTAGNQAVQRLVGSRPVTVQRGLTAGLKRAMGRGKKQPAWAQAEQAGLEAQDAKILTPKDLERQISTLESATKKLAKSHLPTDMGAQVAATQVQIAAQKILDNAQKTGATAGHVKRLRWIIDENQLRLDVVRVEGSKRQAQNIFLEGGRAAKGTAGALEYLQTPTAFAAKAADGPAPNAKVKAAMDAKGFTSFDQLYEEALADPDHGAALKDLSLLQPELLVHVNQTRGKATGLKLGLSEAEVAAIQAYTANDYTYINPATSNDKGWMGTFGGKGTGATEAESQKKMSAIQQEGSLHTAFGVQGLLKLPVWKGLAYRGQTLQFKQFHDLFVKEGEGFRGRSPTFAWNTITSISKNDKAARDFVGAGKPGIAAVLWTMDVTNGRDIEALSVNRGEEEVAILPGARFAISSIEVVQKAYTAPGPNGLKTPWMLYVKCKQVS